MVAIEKYLRDAVDTGKAADLDAMLAGTRFKKQLSNGRDRRHYKRMEDAVLAIGRARYKEGNWGRVSSGVAMGSAAGLLGFILAIIVIDQIDPYQEIHPGVKSFGAFVLAVAGFLIGWLSDRTSGLAATGQQSPNAPTRLEPPAPDEP